MNLLNVLTMKTSSSPKRVLLMEPNVAGHHGVYLRWMAEGLMSRGHTVAIVTTPQNLEHPSLASLRDKACNNLTLLPLVSSAGTVNMGKFDLIKREFTYWRLFRRWYQQAVPTFQPDTVFLPYVDYCLYAIGLMGSPFGSTPWAGLAMRPSFHYQTVGVKAPVPSLANIKRRLFFKLLRQPSLRTLLTIDEPLMIYMKGRPNAQNVRFFPEPADMLEPLDKQLARDLLGVTPRKLLLVYGAITNRKGVFELLSALRDPAFPPNVDVLLAGRVADEIKHLLREPWVQLLEQQNHLHIIDRFLNDSEEAAAFSAADIVWLGYRQHYAASGVLVQAGRMSLPVIACEEGIIGWQTKRHRLGLCVQPEQATAVAEAVRRVVYDRQGSVELGRNGRLAFSRNTLQTATDILVEALT